MGTRHRRDAWKARGPRDSGRQTGDRLSWIPRVSDRYRTGNLKTRVGEVSWLRGAVFSPGACRRTEKACLASRSRRIYPRDSWTGWRKIGRRAAGAGRRSDYDHGARRWIIAYPKFCRGLERRRGNGHRITAARGGNRKYDSLYGESRSRYRSARRPTQATTLRTEDRCNQCWELGRIAGFAARRDSYRRYSST